MLAVSVVENAVPINFVAKVYLKWFSWQTSTSSLFYAPDSDRFSFVLLSSKMRRQARRPYEEKGRQRLTVQVGQLAP